MTTYLETWEKTKQLSEKDLDWWIEQIAPARGRDVAFYGLKVCDVDLLEYLRHWKNDILSYGKPVAAHINPKAGE